MEGVIEPLRENKIVHIYPFFSLQYFQHNIDPNYLI